MKKQTAVEWYYEQLSDRLGIFTLVGLEQYLDEALQMEKKQFMTSYTAGQINALQYINKDISQMYSAEHYYQETYGDKA